MRGIKLDHVACGARSCVAAERFLESVLGAEPYSGGPGNGFRGAQWRFSNGALLEVIEPVGEEPGFLHRFLDHGGPRVHHVTFKVPDIDTAVERLRAFGYDPVGLSVSNPGWKEVFLHPKQAQGLVVQLAESHPELDDNPWLPRQTDVRRDAGSPPAVALLELSLEAEDLDAARRQWSDLLGARCDDSAPRALLFEWPQSPMKIRVEKRMDGIAGPRALRISGSRPIELPRSPQPDLGVAFEMV